MEFQSVEQIAKRLQVTTRTVQKWAKEGKIPGAYQMGRTWLIPVEFGNPAAEIAAAETAVTGENVWDAERSAPAVSTIQVTRPLLDAVFEPGKCLEYVEGFPEGVQRDVLASQYYYFSGQSERAVQLSEGYLDHPDPAAALIASVTYCFANLSLGKVRLFEAGQERIRKYAQMCLECSQDPQVRAYAVYITAVVHVLMHVAVPPMPSLESELQYLPMGARLHAGYLMAHEAYLEKEYGRCLGIVEMALALNGDVYVIPAIYLHLMASVALMNLRRIVEAKAQFEQAWNLARADGFTAIFGEHIGMLQGLMEVSLKKKNPKEYASIQESISLFAEGWRKIHNAGAKRTVTDQLTAVEMAVATLFQRGWAVKEIAAYMEISPRMVRHHISMVYEKLGISHREELTQYLVR